MAHGSGIFEWLGKGLVVAGAVVAGGVLHHLAPEQAEAAIPPAGAFESTRAAIVAPVTPVVRPAFDPVARDYAHGRIIAGGSANRVLLFTFDDGPERRTTPRVLDTLDREGIKAVFFLTTNRIADATPRNRQQAELAREIVRRGHVVGAHSVSHIQLPTLDDTGVAYELDEAPRMIEREIGAHPWLVRPPGGSRSLRIDMMIASRGYTQVLWTLGAGDCQTTDPEVVYQTFFKVLERRAREDGIRGGVVLLHDTNEHTVQALPRILAELRRRNCELLAAGEELYDLNGEIGMFYSPRAAGDSASTEAPMMSLAPEQLEARQARLREETRARCGG